MAQFGDGHAQRRGILDHCINVFGSHWRCNRNDKKTRNQQNHLRGCIAPAAGGVYRAVRIYRVEGGSGKRFSYFFLIGMGFWIRNA